MFEIKCVICRREIDGPIVSARKENDVCTITHALHSDCFENTKRLWIENDWEIMPKTSEES